MADEVCIFCKKTVDDELYLGKKYKCEDVITHYYCLILSSKVPQNGEDDDGILGFMPKDIKIEAERAKQQKCYICNENGANIDCCKKSCKKSFHFPCGIQQNCQFEFIDQFQSFCKSHNGVKKRNNENHQDNVHKPDDMCLICYDEMGYYDETNSIQSPCCSQNTWYHKLCLLKIAQTSGYFLKCPICSDSERFCHSIVRKGVFIPQRDAEWELPNSFYDFQQQEERRTQCAAEECKCPKGRYHKSKRRRGEHSFVFCKMCGGQGVHRNCLIEKSFLCDECKIISKRNDKSANCASTNDDSHCNECFDINGNDKLDHNKHKIQNERCSTNRIYQSVESCNNDTDSQSTIDSDDRISVNSHDQMDSDNEIDIYDIVGFTPIQIVIPLDKIGLSLR